MLDEKLNNQNIAESLKKLIEAYQHGEREFTEVNLENADLSQLDLSGINLSNANLCKAKLIGTKLNNANLSGANLVRADLQQADLSQANLNKANLEGAKLDAANLNAATLVKSNLNYVYMPCAQLFQANLQDAELSYSEFTGANLEECTLDKVRLWRARVRKANFKKASLKQAYLQECKLQFSDFTGANLQKADLSKAILDGVNLTQTDLRGAEIADAKQANTQLAILGKLDNQIIEHSLHLELKNGLGKSIAFSTDGNLFAYYNKSQKVVVIDLESRDEINNINIQTEPVVSVAFSADGQTLHKSFYTNELKLWNPLTGNLISNLKNHSANITSLVLDSNGKGLGIIGIGKPFELHNIGHETRTLKGYSSGIQTQAYSPDGYFLARSAPDTDGQIELINRQTGTRVCIFSGHKAAVQSLSFSPDSKLLASRSSEDFKVWQMETRKEIHSSSQPFPSFHPCITFTDASNRYNPILVSSDFYGSFESKNFNFSRKRDRDYDFSGGGGYSCAAYVTISADKKVFARRFDEQAVQLWNLETGQELSFLNLGSKYDYLIALSSQGEILAASSTKEITLWDVQTKNVICNLTGHTGYVKAIAFCLGSRVLASSSRDLTLKLWSVQEGNEIKTISVPETITALAFSPQNSVLASGHNYGTIKLWDLNKMEEIHSFKAHHEEVEDLVFSPDGKLLASSESDRFRSTIRLWKLKFN